MATAVTPSLVSRELPRDEWAKWQGHPPFDQIPGMSFPTMPGAKVFITQNNVTGEVVAYWMLFPAWHVEPFYVAPQYRGRVGLLRRMWKLVAGGLREVGAALAFAVIADQDIPSNLSQVVRLGFRKLPGSLYFVIPDEITERFVKETEAREETHAS